MAAARGDTRPCTRTECAGTMQFGRQSLRQASTTMPVEGERGWVCSDNVAHFQPESERSQPDATARSSARARWEDDGGQQVGPRKEPSMVGRRGADL